MISDGSCDTEDWSNDAENTRMSYFFKYIQIEILINDNIINYHNISRY